MKRESSGPSSYARARRPISLTMSAAAATALAPSAGMAEWASRPVTSVRNVATLLCASATAIIVGSPTMTAAGQRLVLAEPAR